eukprot:366245-Chlamydomonas_euryale.AAC.36
MSVRLCPVDTAILVTHSRLHTFEQSAHTDFSFYPLMCMPTRACPRRKQARADGFSSWLAPPPQPVMFPRRSLDQRFAVLLMRSTYEAVDDLDFMPMDKFQVKFWRYRASEQEGYNLQYSPLKVRLVMHSGVSSLYELLHPRS